MCVYTVPRPSCARSTRKRVWYIRLDVCAELACSENKIRLLGLEILCDAKCFQTSKQLQNLIRCGPYHIMIVRLCYTVYIQLLTSITKNSNLIYHTLFHAECGRIWEQCTYTYFVSASAVDVALVVWLTPVGMVVLVMTAMLILIILCIWTRRWACCILIYILFYCIFYRTKSISFDDLTVKVQA